MGKTVYVSRLFYGMLPELFRGCPSSIFLPLQCFLFCDAYAIREYSKLWNSSAHCAVFSKTNCRIHGTAFQRVRKILAALGCASYYFDVDISRSKISSAAVPTFVEKQNRTPHRLGQSFSRFSSTIRRTTSFTLTPNFLARCFNHFICTVVNTTMRWIDFISDILSRTSMVLVCGAVK